MGLVLIGRALLSNSLLQFSVDGWSCVPSLPFTWGQIMVEVMKIMKVFPGGSEGKVSAYNAGGPGSIPGSGRSPGEGNGNPLQFSWLEYPMDGGDW